MTFYPYALKLKAGDSDELLDLASLQDNKPLIRTGDQIVAGPIAVDQIANFNFPIPTDPSQIANKQYVDDVAAEIMLNVSLDEQAFLKLDGSRPMRGSLNLDGYSISDLGDPLLPGDATNKDYVDRIIGDAVAALELADKGFLKLDGSRPMAGDLALDGYAVRGLADPSDLSDAANKGYVDTQLASLGAELLLESLGFLKLDGSRGMQGNLNIDGYIVENLKDPISQQDAATKNYVDLKILEAVSGVSINDLLKEMAFLKLDGSRSMTGNLNLDGYAIVNLADPAESQDAVNKGYVDGIVAELGSDLHAEDLLFLKLDGSRAMAGDLDLDGYFVHNILDPVSPQDAATKKYVDAEIAQVLSGVSLGDLAFLRLDGSRSMAGSLRMDGYVVTGLGEPLVTTDATTKGYVDSQLQSIFTQLSSSDLGFLKLDGSRSMTGDLNLDGYAIINLIDPLADQDAVNKRYVDISISTLLATVSSADLAFLKLDGSRSMKGNLDLDGYVVENLKDPVSLQDAATKNYVDLKVLEAVTGVSIADLIKEMSFLRVDGSRPMEGNLNLDGYSVINLADPIDPQDAATKNYIDLGLAALEQSTAESDLQFLKLDGSRSMAGDLLMDGYLVRGLSEPAQNNDAATKLYVDTARSEILDQVAAEDATFLKLDGSRSMHADLRLDGYLIRDVHDPIDAQDAATKGFVDVALEGLRADMLSADLQFLKLDGSRPMSGSLDLDGYLIINLLDPLLPQDAATKYYVDTNIADVLAAALEADLQFLKIDGTRSMTGNLDLDGYSILNLADPSAPQHAATKQYVDDGLLSVLSQVAVDSLEFLKLDGSRSMLGNLDLDGYLIENVKNPISQQDAATKKYVDDRILEVAGGVSVDSLAFLRIDGTRPMAADLNMDGYKVIGLADPTDMQDAATKHYTETFASNRHLSNLCPETAINQWLIPNQDTRLALGAQRGAYGYSTARNWASVFSHEFISAGTAQLYLASCSPDMELDNTGRDVHIEADGTGLLPDTDGGDIYLSTAVTSGSGVRGAVLVDASHLDVGSSQIKNVAAPSSGSDAATKEYVDVLARLAVRKLTSDYELTVADRVILADTSAQEVYIDLPSAVGQEGLIFNIKRINGGANILHIRAKPGQTVDGSNVAQFLVQWESATLVSDGSNWFVV